MVRACVRACVCVCVCVSVCLRAVMYVCGCLLFTLLFLHPVPQARLTLLISTSSKFLHVASFFSTSSTGVQVLSLPLPQVATSYLYLFYRWLSLSSTSSTGGQSYFYLFWRRRGTTRITTLSTDGQVLSLPLSQVASLISTTLPEVAKYYLYLVYR